MIATLSITFTPQTTGNHRVCWKKTTDIIYDCSTIIAGVAGVPVTASISVTVVDDPCEPATFEGYVQPTCEPQASALNRTDFPDVVYTCGACACPEGYVYNPGTGFCEQVTITAATISTSATIYSIQKAARVSSNGPNRSRLYEDITSKVFPINAWLNGVTYPAVDNAGAGTALTLDVSIPTNLILTNPGTTGGRLNACGINTSPGWPGAAASPWLSVTYCITVPETKQYIFAIGGDNEVKADIRFNSVGPYVNIVNLWGGTSPTPSGASGATTYPFSIWHMFPITLNAGTHILRLSGRNALDIFNFGGEVYNMTRAEMLTFINTAYPDPGATAPYTASNALTPYILFTTKQLVVTPALTTVLPTESATYSCESGESNFCYGLPSCVTVTTTPCI
jgi:hypothetical protein